MDTSNIQRIRRNGQPKELLMARGALLDAVEGIEARSIGAGRAMTEAERREFDECAAHIKGIGEDLAEYKRQRIADCADSELSPVLPF